MRGGTGGYSCVGLYRLQDGWMDGGWVDGRMDVNENASGSVFVCMCVLTFCFHSALCLCFFLVLNNWCGGVHCVQVLLIGSKIILSI